jgi:hypothetical protein
MEINPPVCTSYREKVTGYKLAVTDLSMKYNTALPQSLQLCRDDAMASTARTAIRK